MRTTLNIDDDVLIAVKELARRESKSLGDMMSSLVRQSLTHGGSGTTLRTPSQKPNSASARFPSAAGIVTNELIDRLREETGD